MGREPIDVDAPSVSQAIDMAIDCALDGRCSILFATVTAAKRPIPTGTALWVVSGQGVAREKKG